VAGWILTARYVGRIQVPALSWRILLAGLVMGVVIYPMRNFSGFTVALPIVVGVIVYAVAIFLLRALDRDEIRWARRALATAR